MHSPRERGTLPPKHPPPVRRAELRAELQRYFGVNSDAELREIAHRMLEALGDIGAGAIAA